MTRWIVLAVALGGLLAVVFALRNESGLDVSMLQRQGEPRGLVQGSRIDGRWLRRMSYADEKR
jgi:hypothetical protein